MVGPDWQYFLFDDDYPRRAIYIAEASKHHWQALVSLVRAQYPISSLTDIRDGLVRRVGDEWPSIDQLLGQSDPDISAPYRLHVGIDQDIHLLTDFFDESPLELWFYSNTVTHPGSFQRIIQFMKELAAATESDVSFEVETIHVGVGVGEPMITVDPQGKMSISGEAQERSGEAESYGGH